MVSTKDPIMAFEASVIEPLSAEASIRALALLARWALRGAQKRRQGVEGKVGKVVTVDYAKGSGPGEAGELT